MTAPQQSRTFAVDGWSPSSWRSRPTLQQPEWPDRGALAAATADSRKPLLERLTLREYALIAICAASALLAALPLLLAAFGSRHAVGVRLPPAVA